MTTAQNDEIVARLIVTIREMLDKNHIPVAMVYIDLNQNKGGVMFPEKDNEGICKDVFRQVALAVLDDAKF